MATNHRIPRLLSFFIWRSLWKANLFTHNTLTPLHVTKRSQFVRWQIRRGRLRHYDKAYVFTHLLNKEHMDD